MASLSALCLSFMALYPADKTKVPAPVADLAKSRVRQQFSQAHPDISLSFDEERCPNKGRYYFDSENLKLDAETDFWSGERDYLLSDLIEGRQIAFPSLQDARSTFAPQVPQLQADSRRPLLKGLQGAGLGLMVGAAGGAILSPNSESRALNGIVFGLTGALAGGLLSMISFDF